MKKMNIIISFSYCGECKNCLKGHPGSCNDFRLLNVTGVTQDKTHRLHKNGNNVATLFGQSSLATHVVTHVNNLVRVDDDIDLRLLGPLACGIQTGAGTVLSKLKPNFGDTIVIFDCGGVGLSAIMAAKLANCSSIIAVDINEDRLSLAKELGATHSLNGEKVNVVEEIQEITDGGADFSIETSGIPSVLLQAVRCLISSGTAAIVSIVDDVTLNIRNDILSSSRTIVGVIEGDVIPKVFIPTLINYYKQGKFPFDKLIKFYSLEEINTAVTDMHNGTTIKPVILFD